MNYQDEIKKNELNLLLDLVSDASDKNYQRRVWINLIGPELQNFDDFINDFNDSKYIIERYKNYDITDDQHNLLVKFEEAFEKFKENNDDPELFIDTPEWDHIVKLAQEIIRSFNYKPTYASTRCYETRYTQFAKSNPDYFTEERKKSMVQDFLQLISEVADKDYHKEIWINDYGITTKVFDEFINQLHIYRSYIIPYGKDFPLTQEQYTLMSSFNRELDKICDGPYLNPDLPRYLFDTPVWNTLIDLAQKIITNFNYQRKPDDSDKYYLLSGQPIPTKYSKEEARDLLKEFLRLVKQLSDIEYQKTNWINPDGTPSKELPEILNYIYNLKHVIANKYKMFLLTENENYLILELDKQINRLVRKLDFSFNLPKDFMDMPIWQLIISCSQKVTEAFSYRIENLVPKISTIVTKNLPL